MDKKLKYGLIIGGGALIVGAIVLRGSGGDRTGPSGDVISANVAMNAAALQFRTVLAETNADIVMNRDKVTGATQIGAMQTFSNILASGNDLTARLQESYAGIVNARIYSDTTKHVEDTRASVAKKIAKYQYKAAKHGATMDFFGELGGNLIKGVSNGIAAFA